MVGTSFWKDRWVGDAPLHDTFPHLFAMSNQEAKVGDLWLHEEGGHGTVAS
jgi:hypothetical protein